MEWDRQPIGDGQPGPVAAALRDLFAEDMRAARDRVIDIPYRGKSEGASRPDVGRHDEGGAGRRAAPAAARRAHRDAARTRIAIDHRATRPRASGLSVVAQSEVYIHLEGLVDLPPSTACKVTTRASPATCGATVAGDAPTAEQVPAA